MYTFRLLHRTQLAANLRQCRGFPEYQVVLANIRPRRRYRHNAESRSQTLFDHLNPPDANGRGRRRCVAARFLSHDEERGAFDDNVESAKTVSRAVEGLPIAIAHEAGYVGQSGRSLSYFLEQFQERRKASAIWSMDSSSCTTQQYERALAIVCDLALSVLGPEARSLMDVLAMLNADSIPEDILLEEGHRNPIEYVLL